MRTGTAAGGDTEEKTLARVYQDPKQCAEDGVFTQNYCNEKFAEAQKEHIEIAPKFETKEQCEDETGTAAQQRQQTRASLPLLMAQHQAMASFLTVEQPATTAPTRPPTAAASFFMPYMFGYMMGSNNSSSNNYVARPLYGAPGSTSGNRTFLTPEGHPIGGSTGRVSVPHSSIGEGHANGTANRGGFGTTGRTGGFGGRSFGG
ncbi:MAG: DUF1190 domain-containing protein [Candidatus Obscuribacter sp.]|nr:DUF1190 domain-containing protein [Candidatus Obscuribacter sp.]